MNDQANKTESVPTTIGEGSPRGSDRAVPCGVEVLLKKAAVDAEFRERLFEERGGVATAIELELDPAESAMLKAIPREQLEDIVARTFVPVEQRRVFLGRIAAPMLAVLGVAATGCGAKSTDDARTTQGMRPDMPRTNQPPAKPPPAVSPSTNPPALPVTKGIRPDRP